MEERETWKFKKGNRAAAGHKGSRTAFQKGNKAHQGHKGSNTTFQKRNKAALKHGGYSRVSFDTLEAEELAMIESMDTNIERLLMDTIRLYTVRERRTMQTIRKYMDMEEDTALLKITTEEHCREFRNDQEREEYEKRIQEQIRQGKRLPGDFQKVKTERTNRHAFMLELSRILTGIQSGKLKALEALTAFRRELAELEGQNKDSDLLQAWVDAVTASRSLQEGNTEE